jgi:hypothetical protein
MHEESADVGESVVAVFPLKSNVEPRRALSL